MYAVQSGAIILMLPGTPFNLACGFLFDVWIGEPFNFDQWTKLT